MRRVAQDGVQPLDFDPSVLAHVRGVHLTLSARMVIAYEERADNDTGGPMRNTSMNNKRTDDIEEAEDHP